MTMFEKRSAGTTYDDRDSHHDRDSHQQRDSHHERDRHQQRAGVATAGNVLSTWIVAMYDYAEQVLKAQRQFAHSMLGAAAPMRDVTSPEVNEDRSANNRLDARSDQHHDDANRLRRNNEHYNDDDTAEYNKRWTTTPRRPAGPSEALDDSASEASRTERVNPQAKESAQT